MHTMRLTSKYYGTVHVHHNSDWSGMAHISYSENGEKKEASIPCALLLALGKEAALDFSRSAFVRVFEDLTRDGFPDIEKMEASDEETADATD